ncbi:DUF1573 domain-containing protein [Arundinibacter roseus]|uniref:DUF1573 domain-containing protein n=1 Tax=Arundinibacter roseus TaxID=2070510 RepID=A0A4R4KEY0_9BACT|nr:DUF1573 domain-containing protein [Arundinibacter roseus]TDB65111.1 DUF1573 domain-containing protein [Arundinibacter roseus]
MKKNQFQVLLLLVTLGVWLAACGTNTEKGRADELKEKMPVMTLLDSATFQFGSVKEGDIVEHTFRFRNEGEFPLIINNVSASCGCTIPEWPRDPIAPEEESSILVRFNSKGKPGQQVKTITVYANTEPASSELRLQGIVQAAADSVAIQ